MARNQPDGPASRLTDHNNGNTSFSFVCRMRALWSTWFKKIRVGVDCATGSSVLGEPDKVADHNYCTIRLFFEQASVSQQREFQASAAFNRLIADS